MSHCISDYDFYLPKSYIAHLPLENRQDSKLMVLDRMTKKISHKKFMDLKEYLNAGDVVVFNDAKVIPARLLGKKNTGGKVEVFLLQSQANNNDIIWEVLTKPGLKKKAKVYFSDLASCEILDVLEEGKRLVKFNFAGDFYETLDSLGKIPLPPYINYDKQKEDFYQKRYQTVFAKKEGAVAAPTAGLHFDDNIISDLANLGVKIAYLTLYVGIGTFKPIQQDNYLEHKMHKEFYELSKETVDIINTAKKNGNKIFAIGTTVTRVLEGVYKEQGFLKSGEGSTDIFIYPEFEFKVVDKLFTNFHLPKSTLLLMISAFAEKNFILNAYEEAKQNNYRFFSFGDAMLIV
jgi:S-adenosylmethionine:tRNA ribosyltransferase-isomerase